MVSRPRRVVAFMFGLAILITTIVGGPNPASAGVVSDRGPSTLELQRCLLTVHFLYEPNPKRFSDEDYLPQGYTPARVANPVEPLGPLAARLEIWTFSCGNMRVGRGNDAPGMLSFISIAIEDRPAHHYWPGISDNYLIWGFADRADLVHALEVKGIPAMPVKEMTFGWRQGPLNPWEGFTAISVPWSASPYELGVRGLPGTNTPHHHDNTFQHSDRVRGKSSLEFHVLLPPAQDLLCMATHQAGVNGWDGDPTCGVKAMAGTDLARLLGDNPYTAEFDPTTKTGAAADHDMIWKATIVVTGS